MEGFANILKHVVFGEANNLGKTLNDAFVLNNNGYSTITFHCTAPTGGVITFEGTIDGVNWDTFTCRSITDDIYQNSTDDNSDFIGSIIGLKQLRFRTSTEGSANGTIKGMLLPNVAIIESQEFGFPPHRFGYTPIHKDGSYTTAQTGQAIWTPTTGKKFVITDLVIVVGGTTDGSIKIFDETDSSGNYIFKGTIDVSNNKQYSFNHAFKTPYLAMAVNNVLKITTSADMTVDVNVHGYEI